ncbi:hypothetical protein [Streptomyces chiangmaiensis]|uniref:hypothetical protein n=1 Tax=Streptomyces chiangmaiensis TaxID=766497 RepID=UPI0031EA6B54
MALIEKTPATVPDVAYTPAHVIHRRVLLERLTYGAATLGITIAPQYEGLWPAHVAAGIGAVASAAWLWRKDEEGNGWHSFLRTCQRILPGITGSVLYLVNLASTGTKWWEIAASAGWGLTMAGLAPITRSRHLPTDIAPAQTGTLDVQAAPRNFEEWRAYQWAAARTTGSTRLTHVTRYQRDLPDFHGIVVAEFGEAVPDLNPTQLAAVFDCPVGAVWLEDVPNSGPGRKHLIAAPTWYARQTLTDSDPMRRLWEAKISHPKGAAPGMLLTDYRVDENRIALRVTAPDGELIQLNQKRLARAFEVADATLLMVETDGLGEGLISIYKTHPLMNVREATIEDLTMQPDGTIALGQQPDGRIGRVPLYDPQMGAITDLYVGAPGAGKSVTLLHVIAAERLSGIVSIVADAQDGMSLPEVDGRVYHFGKGIAATAATLAAANDLGKYREKISAENSWGSFEIGNPWPLVNVTLDELNRILSADAVVPRPFRKWVTGLVGDTQSTGRKLGLGIRFAAQSIHLADLGDKDRIRANAKNGTVWLGRTNSSTTQHMARDGVLPPGVELVPIPRYFGTGSGSPIDAAFEGKEAAHGPITAGMANIINGGSLYTNRTWFARKENKTYPHLINLMESRPVPHLTEEENIIFQLSYERWLAFAEALLAGEGEDEGISNAVNAEQAARKNNPFWPDDEDDDQPSAGSIKDRILDQLTDGPMSLKDIRRHLDDVAPGSVNNAMAELREAGHVTALSRGIYQLTQ